MKKFVFVFLSLVFVSFTALASTGEGVVCGKDSDNDFSDSVREAMQDLNGKIKKGTKVWIETNNNTDRQIIVSRSVSITQQTVFAIDEYRSSACALVRGTVVGSQ